MRAGSLLTGLDGALPDEGVAVWPFQVVLIESTLVQEDDLVETTQRAAGQACRPVLSDGASPTHRPWSIHTAPSRVRLSSSADAARRFSFLRLTPYRAANCIRAGAPIENQQTRRHSAGG